ncbi:MAG: hypothetical protein KJ615_04540, partial [Bacteroidetes bacterium]|nr:hypothetical protein [Bacteroidota bacterium]
KEGLENTSPVALGDGPLWVEGQPDESMFGVYGSAHAGIFGAIIERTNVEGILKLDCLATDFYNNDSYPTYLIYNPHNEGKMIKYAAKSPAPVDLFDVVTKKVILKNVISETEISIPAKASKLIVEIPAGLDLKKVNGKVMAGNIVIAY